MSAPRLYELLPEIYRLRDEQTLGLRTEVVGQPPAAPPLKALFAILQSLYDELESDIEGLYDDWFVETCRPEMLATFAEMLAIDDLAVFADGGADVRALVANMIAHRQRKGTVTALQEIARDATSWAVQVVDGLRSTATNVRVDDRAFAGYVDVRAAHSPSDLATGRVSVDVRDNVAGLRCVSLSVWRMRASHMVGVEPGRPTQDGRHRTVSSLGHDKALMRPVQIENDDGRSGYRFAAPLTRSDARERLAQTGELPYLRLVESDGTPAVLRVADLSRWSAPPLAARRTVYIDPELGRILTPDAQTEYQLECYTAPYHDVGAGVPSRPWPGTFDLTVLVAPQAGMMESDGIRSCATFREALAIVSSAGGTCARARIVLGDSKTHRSADKDWLFAPTGSVAELAIDSAPGARPTLEGVLRLEPPCANRLVILRGLNMRASVVCAPNVVLSLDSVTLHAPLPGTPGPADAIDAQAAQVGKGTRIGIKRSILGSIALGSTTRLTIEESIVMGAVRSAQSGGRSEIAAYHSSFLGRVDAESMSASDSLFDRAVWVNSQHRGYMRYCVLRPGSHTPQRYRCVETAHPLLASTYYGRLAFARLRLDAPAQVLTGASNGSEMGAFNRYGHALRAANLDRVIKEYVPEGVGVRVVYRS